MKKFALAVALSMLGAGTSVAADMAVKARPALPPVVFYNWTGGYVGVNIGGVHGDTDVGNAFISDSGGIAPSAVTVAALAGNGGTNGWSVIGGAQIGYNWQGSTNWVVGVEADIQGMGLRQNRTSPIVTSLGDTAQDFDQVEHTWLATFRGRAGYAWDRTLWYLTGGLAVGDTRFSRTQTWSFGDGCPIDPRNGLEACHVGSASKTSVGAVAGVGVEYAFASNWSAKLEYLHVWLPDQPSFRTTNVGLLPGITQIFNQTTGDSNLDIIRVGVNYHFAALPDARY